MPKCVLASSPVILQVLQALDHTVAIAVARAIDCETLHGHVLSQEMCRRVHVCQSRTTSQLVLLGRVRYCLRTTKGLTC